jgi:hypothetical protein
MLQLIKRALPNRAYPMRIVRGPFRGARVMMNPRVSLRKAFGLYEHELNDWLERALDRVSRVLDVGANDGYFTFGCAAALHRRGTAASIVAFEPQRRHVEQLSAAARHQIPGINIEIVPAMVGKATGEGTTTLDAQGGERDRTLIKIDVEGAELDVVEGAQSWLRPSNLFLIEVHRRSYLDLLEQHFANCGLPLVRIEQRPLPILGREARDAENWWLVSRLE